MCLPRKPATAWASLYSPSPGRRSSAETKSTSPNTSPPHRMGAATAAAYCPALSETGSLPGAVLIDAALLHDLLQLRRKVLAQQLPLPGPGYGHDAVPVGNSGGEIRVAGQGVAELGGEVLQSADEGVLLENDFPVPCGVDLQRVALTDTHGAADLLGDHDPAQVIDAPHDPSCFHLYTSSSC